MNAIRQTKHKLLAQRKHFDGQIFFFKINECPFHERSLNLLFLMYVFAFKNTALFSINFFKELDVPLSKLQSDDLASSPSHPLEKFLFTE